jgi:error-prone DNA polymerase
MAFAELCATSNFTFLTGGSHPEEYARRAAEMGMPAFAVADRNSVAGVVRAHLETREITRDGGRPARLVPGARLCTGEGVEVTALPVDRAGWGRLCRLLTAGKRAAGKGECRLGLRDVAGLRGCRLLLHPIGPWRGAARALMA